jgi:serine/threonine protein phosphatase 1
MGRLADLLAYLKCIDTFCHGGSWLTALEVEGGRRVWQANEAGVVRG